MRKTIPQIEAELEELAQKENLTGQTLYTYKDHNYRVKHLGQVYDEAKSDWNISVSYTQEGSSLVFTRTLTDFQSKFKLVK